MNFSVIYGKICILNHISTQYKLSTTPSCLDIYECKTQHYGVASGLVREAAKKKKNLFLVDMSTKAFTPPPRLSGHLDFFFRLKIAGNGF